MLEPHLLGRYNKENWFLGFWMMEIQEGGKNILLFLLHKWLPEARKHMGKITSRNTEEFGLIRVPAETERLVLIPVELTAPVPCDREHPLQHTEAARGHCTCWGCPPRV